METNELDYTKIVGIDNRGLAYLDQEGNTARIDFKVCRNNWMKYISSTKEFTQEETEGAVLNCVGERDASAQPKYFRFFCDPKVTFVFPAQKKFIQKVFQFPTAADKAFSRIHQELDEAGWTTYDLS